MWICLTIIFVFLFFLVVGLLTKDKKKESKENSLLEPEPAMEVIIPQPAE